MILSKRKLRQLKTLNRFCEFDMENSIATIILHYDSVDEILDNNRSTFDNPVISSDSIIYIENIINLIPREFQIDFALVIKDYKGFTPDTILNTYKLAIEHSYYLIDEQDKSTSSTWLILGIIGFLIVFFRLLGIRYEWFGTAGTLTSLILIGTIEIFSEVFFEESMVFFILSKTRLDFFKERYLRFNAFKLRDSGGHTLAYTHKNSFFNKWVGIERLDSLARGYLFYFSFAAFILTGLQCYNAIINYDIIEPSIVIFSIAIFAMGIVVTLSNISYYQEKYFLKKHAIPLSILLCIIEISSLVTSLVVGGVPSSLNVINIIAIIGLALNVLALSYVWNRRYNIQKKDSN